MDFPGTINTHYETFIKQVLDITQSLAYHGFKKIILLNGHGSNMPNLDLAARRTNLETDAECILVAWWQLLTIDSEFLPSWRESEYPGGFSHACELETSLYLYLDEDGVRKDRIKNHISTLNDGNPYIWGDLIGHGPGALTSWTSTYSPRGVMGQPELATVEKGRLIYEEGVKQLSGMIEFFHGRPKDVRTPHQANETTMPIPWNQREIPPTGG
jgi:creatinine amidohydrolase